MSKRPQNEEATGSFIDDLDPGIRDTVMLLRDRGFETTDSGDGQSKDGCGVADDNGVVHHLAFPHVAAKTTCPHLFEDAKRMQALLREHGPDGLSDWSVEGTFSPDGGCTLFARANPPDMWNAMRTAIWRAIKLYAVANAEPLRSTCAEEVDRLLTWLVIDIALQTIEDVRFQIAAHVEKFRDRHHPDDGPARNALTELALEIEDGADFRETRVLDRNGFDVNAIRREGRR